MNPPDKIKDPIRESKFVVKPEDKFHGVAGHLDNENGNSYGEKMFHGVAGHLDNEKGSSFREKILYEIRIRKYSKTAKNMLIRIRKTRAKVGTEPVPT